MPNIAVICIDAVVFALTVLWLWQTLGRSPSKYRRERLAANLAQQFKKSNVDVRKYTDGRSVDELNADEIYILGKVLSPADHDR